MKSRKSHKTYLTDHTQSISHHIMLLVINTLRSGHTHTHTHTHTLAEARTKVILRNQVRTWLNKYIYGTTMNEKLRNTYGLGVNYASNTTGT